MKLKEGKRYVTREGDITEPLQGCAPPYEGTTFKAVVGEDGPTVHWYSDGRHMPNGEPHRRDLVAVYTEHPETSDMVNHPPHYQSAKGVECIDAIEAAMTVEEFRGYLRGNCLKYLWRSERKGGEEDLKKGAWYLNKLIETPKP